MADTPEAYAAAFRRAWETDEMKGLSDPIRTTLANAYAATEDEPSSHYAESVASDKGLAPPVAVRNALGASYARAAGHGLSGEKAWAAAQAGAAKFAEDYHAAIRRGDSPEKALEHLPPAW